MTRLADWATRPRGFDEWAQIAVTALVLVGCPLFILGALHPSKLALPTTPAGGDMGAHVWAPGYLRHHLLPHGRLTGWSPDWYDGFPALTFYFPLPYLAIALLSYVLPYGVAFKLVSASGLVGLPLAAYAMGRLTGMRFPGPPLLAVATVPFLFDRYFTIWGGNIASTLAGEFAFSISLCLALVFIGVFARALETGRLRWLAALVFAATLLCHLLPAFFAIAGALIVWLLRPSRRRLGTALVVGSIGLAVTAFWLVPFAVRHGYSNDMGWERTTAYAKGLFPFLCSSHRADASINCPTYSVVHPYTVHLKVVAALAAAGVFGGVVLRRRSTLLIGGLGACFAAAFRFMPQGALWNARMLPFWYLCLYLAAAACLAESAIAIGVLLGRAPRSTGDVLPDLPSQPGMGLAPAALADERRLVGAGVGAGVGVGVGGGTEKGAGAGAGAGANRVGGGSGATALGVWGGHRTGAGAVGGGPEQEGWRDGEGSRPNEGEDDSRDAGDPWADSGGGRHGGDGRGGDVPAEASHGDLVPNRWPVILTPVLVALLVLAFVGQSVPDYASITKLVLHNRSIGGADQRRNENFVSSWSNWNYSGYEKKAAYPEYKDVVDTMARVGREDGCGRAMWEYESEEDRFGTPMALMLLPKWTNGCIGSQEGLYFESSATVPYHFLNQSELSVSGSRAMRDLPYRNFDIVDGIAHLQLLGVRYYMTVSPAAQAAARTLTGGDHPLLRLVAQTASHQVQYTTGGTSAYQARTWQVYEVAGADPVAPLSYEPVVMTGVPPAGKGWLKASTGWYQDRSRWDVPLAASGPAEWRRVSGADPNPPRTAVRPTVITNTVTTDDRISFDVDQPGSPVLVRTSYFPNWQATGAGGPWRVTPNLMVVIPTSRHVELHYGFTPVDNAGLLLSVGGLAGVGLLWRRDRRTGDDAPGDGGGDSSGRALAADPGGSGSDDDDPERDPDPSGHAPGANGARSGPGGSDPYRDWRGPDPGGHHAGAWGPDHHAGAGAATAPPAMGGGARPGAGPDAAPAPPAMGGGARSGAGTAASRPGVAEPGGP